MGTTDSRPLARSSDSVGTLCTRCGRTCPAQTLMCASCGAELDGETVLIDVHAMETALLGRSSASTSDTDVTRDSAARRSSVADLAPVGVSSSDPPTRFLRGIDQHIELPSGSVVDDYEIDAKLGAGAMGIVYSARHARLGRRVALKVISPTMGGDPQALARFEREARALASLQHPNVVDVYAFGTLPDRRSYFVMEYLAGEALDERLARERVPLDEALDVLDQMARALEAAHAQGIVHRDLKPSNTFLVRLPREQRPVVKLLDFGLIKLAVADDVENTASGAVIGTSLYLSPEQARSPNVDHRTDIYSLGVVAYELVLGRHPFPEARTATAALAAHLTEPAPQPRTIWPGIPTALDLLLHAMLAKDASYRPTLAQLRNVVASVRSRATAESTARTVARPMMRRALHMRALMAALVVLALFIGSTIGARVLGNTSNRSTSLRVSPVEDGATNQRDGSQEAAPIDADLRAAAIVPDAGAPVDALTPVETRARAIDAGVTAGRGATTSRREVAAAPVDAAISIDVDAATPISDPLDVGQSEEPTDVLDPAVKRGAPPPHRQPSKSETSRVPDERSPALDNRNQTFNPFRGKAR